MSLSVPLLSYRRTSPQILMVLADHGPAVSGAHNTIVTARAGKDLVSSVVSGLLTVGPRFGGALDGALAFGGGRSRRGGGWCRYVCLGRTAL